MPFVRKGKCVYKRTPDGKLTKKGCSSSNSEAKSYQKKLYSVSEDEESGKKEEKTFDEMFDIVMTYFSTGK